MCTPILSAEFNRELENHSFHKTGSDIFDCEWFDCEKNTSEKIKKGSVILNDGRKGIFENRISGEELKIHYETNPLNPNLAVEAVFHVLRTAFLS